MGIFEAVVVVFVGVLGAHSLTALKVSVKEANYHNGIKWIPSDQFSEDLLIPAGYERADSSSGVSGDYTTLYVARVKNATNWVPGKYSPDFKKCWVGLKGKQVEKPESDCQLLTFPKGTTSWIFTGVEDPLPQGMFRGEGVFHGDQGPTELHVCRASKQGQLLLGRLSTKKRQFAKKPTCYTYLNGKEYQLMDYEVLTTNFMTRATKTIVDA